MVNNAQAGHFIDKLRTSIVHNNSLLCVGLDPDITRIPSEFMPGHTDIERQKEFCLQIIEKTSPFAACFKPNIAFFEASGAEGLDALKEVIDYVPNGIPVLLDAKRGDIGNTAQAYARAVFDVLNADAVTVSPYLGEDSVTPFVSYPGKMAFLLCHTSNPSAPEVQHYGVKPLYQHIAKVGQDWGDHNQIGFVVGATQPEALSAVRLIAPDRWILAPGVGAQGGNLMDALTAGLDAYGTGMIVPVSRAVIYADNPGLAAEHLRAEINQARESVNSTAVLARKTLVLELYNAGCIQFGEFLLASGKTSPFYIDLRRIISYPSLFSRVIDAYARCLSGLVYDRLAAVPYAALPLTGALGMFLNIPMIYPRKEVKSYGTAQNIEGVYETGQVVVPVEDVITTGGSLLKSIQTLERAELRIKDVVVLVDREQGGRERLKESGYQLHSVLTMHSILDTLKAEGCIDSLTYHRVLTAET